MCGPGVPDSLLSVQLEEAFLEGEFAILSSRGRKTRASSSETCSAEKVIRPCQQGAQRAAAIGENYRDAEQNGVKIT